MAYKLNNIKKRLHLDYHNHRVVEGIGCKITSENFERSIRELGIDSAALFAKCHHGLSYYPTAIGKPHPGMKGDLLGAQVEACEAAGVEYHLYFSVLRENYAFDNYPEWRYIGPDGNPSSSGSEYRLVCINTGYYDEYLKPQIVEALRRYPGAAGAWLDIIRYKGNACYCPNCTDDAARLSLSPQEFNHRMLLEKYADIKHTLEQMGKELTLNTIVFLGNQEWRFLTPLEIESILAHVGPFHFPLFSRYLNRYECERYGITHSFHQNWREYGTCKHPVQIEYEVCQMAFAGFGVSLGDQLEADGTFEPRRFEVLKAGYRLADRLNEICDFSLPHIREVAIVNAGRETAQEDGQSGGSRDDFVRGALKILLESHYQVEVIDAEEDYSPYKLLMVSAASLESAEVRYKLDLYLESGGKALIMGNAGSDGLDWLGLETRGRGSAGYQYLQTDSGDKHLVKCRGEMLESRGKLETWLRSFLPYGDAELGEQESGCLRPPDPQTAFDSVFIRSDGKVVYAAPSIFADYYTRGDWAHRGLVESFLDKLNVTPIVTGSTPASVEVTACSDGITTEIRVLDFSMKRENVGFAQQTEYAMRRDYRFEVACRHQASGVYDCVNERKLPFKMERDRVVVNAESDKPYLVLRIR